MPTKFKLAVINPLSLQRIGKVGRLFVYVPTRLLEFNSQQNLQEFNPHHDALGRFTFGPGKSGRTYTDSTHSDMQRLAGKPPKNFVADSLYGDRGLSDSRKFVGSLMGKRVLQHCKETGLALDDPGSVEKLPTAILESWYGSKNPVGRESQKVVKSVVAKIVLE